MKNITPEIINDLRDRIEDDVDDDEEITDNYTLLMVAYAKETHDEYPTNL